MSQEPRQLVFDLPHRSALGAEDFLVSASNEAAVAVIDRWPDWPLSACFLSGPAGSGKSHLVNVWRQRSGALRLGARMLREAAMSSLGQVSALAIEDIDRGVGEPRVLFHLLNLARERQLALLLTARALPGEIEHALADLRSRLRALPLVCIAEPDEALLRALLVKHFADRQLVVEPHVIEHIALNMERSARAAAVLVADVDRLALATRRRVTRTLAAEALARFARTNPDT